MKTDQNGFSITEGLLLLVVVGILSFTGWYVFHSQGNANNSYNNAVSSGNSQTAASKKAPGGNGQKGASAAGGTSGCSLALSIGQREGAAGTFHENLIFTNKGTGNCTLNGYPTVTLLDSSGNQIGQPAAQDTSVSPAAVTLKPNETANATLSLPDPDIAGNCSANKSAEIAATLTGISGTLKTADTNDYYCPDFMTRPVQK